MIKKTAIRFINAWWKFPVGCLIGVIIATYAPSLIPVVANMQAKDWEVSDDYVQAKVVGWKLRCTLIKNSEVGYLRAQGEPWVEVGFQFLDDPSPGNSKPLGFHSFGIWQWGQLADVTPYQAMITIDHECGDDVVTTSIGPFQIKP